MASFYFIHATHRNTKSVPCNKHIAFIRVDGPQRMMPQKIAKKASVVMDVGDVLIHTSGQADVAVGSSVLLLGIAAKKVAATDSDYASTTSIEIEAIDPNATYEALVSTGTPAASHIGQQFDLEDENSITLSGTSYKQVKVVGLVDSTHVLVKFNPNLL